MIDTVFWFEVVEELDKAAKENLELYCPDRDGCYPRSGCLTFSPMVLTGSKERYRTSSDNKKTRIVW